MALHCDFGINTGVTCDRKELKVYCQCKGGLMGAELEGKRVLLVEDLVATGTKLVEAAKLLQSAGAIVVCAIVVFDREKVCTVSLRTFPLSRP